MTHLKALKIAYNQLSEKLEPHITTQFLGEIYIKIIEDSKKQAKLGIRPQNIFDDLCLKLIN